MSDEGVRLRTQEGVAHPLPDSDLSSLKLGVAPSRSGEFKQHRTRRESGPRGWSLLAKCNSFKSISTGRIVALVPIQRLVSLSSTTVE